jgi:hypothetical protein
VGVRAALVVVVLLAMPRTVVHARLLSILSDPLNAQGDEFGLALTAIGTDVAVGVPGARVFGHDGAGVVRLFDGGGVLRRTFDAQNPVTDAELGTMLAASDGLLYAAAPGDVAIGLGGTGAVYVFDPDRSAPIRIIRAPDQDAGTAPVGGVPIRSGIAQSTAGRPVALGFGRGLAVAGDWVVVGAPDSLVDGLGSAGAVYLFDARASLRRTLREFSPHAGARFGAFVALAGDVVLVGAPGAPAGGVEGAGVVWMFDADTGRELGTLSESLPVEAGSFGAVVGVVGDAIFVGAPGDEDGAGAVYLFDAATRALRRVLTAPTPSPMLGFGGAIAVVNADLLIGAAGAGDGAGRAYLVDPATGLVRATFVPTFGGQFGFALAAVGPSIAIGEPAFDATSGGRVYVYVFGLEDPTVADQAPGGSGVRGRATPPTAVTCAHASTPASLDCRFRALLDSVAGSPRLARPLRRAARAIRSAAVSRGPRQRRAFDDAVHSFGVFAGRLDAENGATRMPSDLRARLLADVPSVETDLATLAGAPVL